jgi:hypothetical protein
LIWPAIFSKRLEAWHSLRERCHNLPIESCLQEINTWWFCAPWRPYYLHWDDQSTWPDPWQLLNDNVYCDLARGLGILYTITLLDRPDLMPTSLILTENGHNLVQATKTKYILNWSPNTIVNNNLELKITRKYQQHPIK